MLDHFGFLAPYYDRFIGPPDPERWRTLLRLPVAGSLLDAGGGTGRVSAGLRPWVERLVISDESARMLAQARSKIGSGSAARRDHAVQGYAEQLPFGHGSFDRVMVVDALHHFAHQPRAIAELARVLKPGGRLVIEEPNLHHFGVRLVALVEKLALMRSRFLYPQQIQAMVTACGLQTSTRSDGGFTAWIIGDKPDHDE